MGRAARQRAGRRESALARLMPEAPGRQKGQAGAAKATRNQEVTNKMARESRQAPAAAGGHLADRAVRKCQIDRAPGPGEGPILLITAGVPSPGR